MSLYTNPPAPLTLKAGDIISVKVGSLTPSEYDFVKEYTDRLGVFGQLIERQRTIQLGGGGQQGGGGRSPSENPQFQQLFGFQLGESGIIELPYIGEIPLEGKTLTEASKMIRDSLESQFKSPIVRVEFLSFDFSVVGEISRPGRYTTYSTELTVMDALLMAGSFTEFSDREHVKLVRTRNGQQEVFYLNMLDESILGSANYFLQPGDMLVVPQLDAKASRLYALPNTSFLIGIVSSGLTLWLLIDRLRE
ncbi:MAG: polysaccharide biosynthesis/export family protein [Bacteroidota bacterium]